MPKLTIIHNCPFCETPRAKEFDEKQFLKYVAGANIQDAMPDASADDREFLISGICPDCWDKYRISVGREKGR